MMPLFHLWTMLNVHNISGTCDCIFIYCLTFLFLAFVLLSILLTGSPKYFSPLLHYLRSGVLEIPPGVSQAALMREAEFYGLQSVMKYFQQLEEEKKKKEAPKKSKREGNGNGKEKEKEDEERERRWQESQEGRMREML